MEIAPEVQESTKSLTSRGKEYSMVSVVSRTDPVNDDRESLFAIMLYERLAYCDRPCSVVFSALLGFRVI